VVALFADKLTASQMMVCLSEGAERFGLANCTLEELGKEFLAHVKMLLERGSVGALYLRDTKNRTKKLVAELGDIPIQSIGTDMLDVYVNKRLADRSKVGKKTSPRTVKNEVTTLSALFNFAIKRGYLKKNLCHDLKLPDYKAPVGICKPEELVTLLAHADHYIQCWIMFGAFGGLRSSEIHRMNREDVRLDGNQFYICGRKNDSAERWVRLTPPLKAFYEDVLNADNPPSGLVMGGMVPQTQTRRIEKVYTAAGVRIPRNGLRHSFGSHHLVAHNNPSNTATEMGHVGPQQTFKAYRKAVLKSQAEDFFAICCEAKPWVLKAGMGIKKPRKTAQKLAA
jgi:integrase